MPGEHSTPSSFLALIYERLAPADDPLRKTAAAVDFGFVTDRVRDGYWPDNGRPSGNPARRGAGRVMSRTALPGRCIAS